MRLSRRAVSVRTMLIGVVCFALAACGGSGSAGRPAGVPNAIATSAAAQSTVRISLTIPARSTLSRRRAAYISPSTQSMLFTAFPGSVATKINLNAQICATSAQTGDKQCTFAVSAPIGNDTFSVIAYDQQFVGGILPNGTNALSSASSFAVTVTEGSANVSVPLITGGIPATVALSLAGGATSRSFTTAAPTVPLTVTAYDADGNIIIAPGVFSNTSGNETPLTIVSTKGAANFGYAVTSAATGNTGSTGATIALAEPDDTVALIWNGTSYVPAGDTLTLQGGLINHVGGATTTALTFGYRFTPPSTPFILLGLSSPIATAVGHLGIAYVAQPNKIAFAGDVTASCTIPSIEAGTVTAIGGATLNAPAAPTDTHVYVSVADNGERVDDEFTLASVLANGTCGLTTGYGLDTNPPGGIAGAGNRGVSVSYSGETIINAMPLNPLGSVNTTDQFALFTPRAVGELPNGTSGFVEFDEKKQIASVDTGADVTAEQALALLTDGVYPTGMTVDANGNIYANDTHSATFGGNGGVDSFTTLASAPNGSAQLQSPIVSTGPTYQLQNMAAGPYAGATALYVVCGDGIEVFPVTSTGFSASAMAPAETISLPAAGTSIVANSDGRMWVLLSDGSLDALLPQ